MKKLLVASVLGLSLAFGATAQAFWVGGVYNNSTNTFANNVMGFDWSSSGSGLVLNQPIGTPLALGQVTTFLYQASLVGLTDQGGNPVSFTGLKTATTPGFEYTVVAMVPEIVLSVTNPIPSLTQAVLATLPGGKWAIYNQATGDANVGAGTGFNNGTLVASGTIRASQLTSFLATGAPTAGNPFGTGIGSTALAGEVTFTDAAFLDPSLTIVDFRFEGQLNAPPLDSEVGAGGSFFDGNDGFPVTNVAGLEQLKVDGSSKFGIVPEPSTVLLLGCGLLGIAGFSRRKAQK